MGRGRLPYPPRWAGIFQNAADLRPGQVHAHQGMNQPDPLRVALEVTQILAHFAAQVVQPLFTFTQA